MRIQSISIRINKKCISLKKFKVIWFRRGHFLFTNPIFNIPVVLDKEIITSFSAHIDSELSTLNDFLYYYIKKNSII